MKKLLQMSGLAIQLHEFTWGTDTPENGLIREGMRGDWSSEKHISFKLANVQLLLAAMLYFVHNPFGSRTVSTKYTNTRNDT